MPDANGNFKGIALSEKANATWERVFGPELIFHVDFNNVHHELVKGSLRHASQARLPRRGERVLLRDWEGTQCYARVEEQRGQIVYFRPDFATTGQGSEIVQSCP